MASAAAPAGPRGGDGGAGVNLDGGESDMEIDPVELEERAEDVLDASACSSAMYLLDVDDVATEDLARDLMKEGCCTPSAGSRPLTREDGLLTGVEYGAIVYRARPAFIALTP